MNNTLPSLFLGVDISKDFLDIYIHPLAKELRVLNSQQGLEKLITFLERYHVTQIVCESSGGYEYLLLKTLRIHGYKVWQVQPKRIRAFIISEGIKAKTDKIDAHMIALFAAQKQPRYELAYDSSVEEQLSALVKRRADLVKIVNQENNVLQHPQQTYCRDSIANHIAFMKEQIKVIEKEIDECIKTSESLKHKAKIIESVPGVGKVTIATLLAEMSELGKISNKQIAALTGVAPIIKQSGNQKGTATISGGRARVRRTLYMAATAAIRFSPLLRSFYMRLRQKGKGYKVALVAVMRKLIVLLNTMISKEQLWQTS
jgi:transposase